MYVSHAGVSAKQVSQLIKLIFKGNYLLYRCIGFTIGRVLISSLDQLFNVATKQKAGWHENRQIWNEFGDGSVLQVKQSHYSPGQAD